MASLQPYHSPQLKVTTNGDEGGRKEAACIVRDVVAIMVLYGTYSTIISFGRDQKNHTDRKHLGLFPAGTKIFSRHDRIL